MQSQDVRDPGGTAAAGRQDKYWSNLFQQPVPFFGGAMCPAAAIRGWRFSLTFLRLIVRLGAAFFLVLRVRRGGKENPPVAPGESALMDESRRSLASPVNRAHAATNVTCRPDRLICLSGPSNPATATAPRGKGPSPPRGFLPRLRGRRGNRNSAAGGRPRPELSSPTARRIPRLSPMRREVNPIRCPCLPDSLPR